MSDHRFPASLKPIVSKGYSYQRGGNVYRSGVTGGLPRQGRDTYFDTVPFNVTLVTSALGNQTFQLFLNKISGGADSFVMALDSGLGVKDHQCQINSTVNIDTSDGINWTISFSLLAERTDIQEDVCLTANLPDLFGCYGDGLNCFLAAYATAQTTFPRIWGDFPVIDFNHELHVLDAGLSLTRASTATYIDGGVLKYAAVNEPRFEDNGLLLEGGSGNMLTYSEQLDNAVWVKGASNVTPDSSLAPSGLMKADKLVESTTNGTHGIAQYQAVSGSAVVTASAYVKAAERTKVGFRCAGSAYIGRVNFDLLTGFASSDNPAITFSMQNVGNGFYRISATYAVQSIATSAVCQLELYGPQLTYTGDGVSGLYVWGGQLEVGSLVTSYIPTISAAAPRQPDIFTTTMPNIKRIRRVYIPAGQSTPIDETIPYGGILCPNGHLQLLQAWGAE